MSQFPIRGVMYVGSITAVAGSSGTLIGSPDGDLFTVEYKERSRELYDFNGNVSNTVVLAQKAELIVNLRDMSSTALDLLYQNLRSSGIGTQISGAARLGGQTAVIIRPKNGTSDNYFYSPGMSNAANAASRKILFSRQQLHTDSNQLRLVENVAVLTEPPSWYGTAAEIAAKYAGVTA